MTSWIFLRSGPAILAPAVPRMAVPVRRRSPPRLRRNAHVESPSAIRSFMGPLCGTRGNGGSSRPPSLSVKAARRSERNRTSCRKADRLWSHGVVLREARVGLGTGHCQGETPSQFLRLTIACKRPPLAFSAPQDSSNTAQLQSGSFSFHVGVALQTSRRDKGLCSRWGFACPASPTGATTLSQGGV